MHTHIIIKYIRSLVKKTMKNNWVKFSKIIKCLDFILTNNYC